MYKTNRSQDIVHIPVIFDTKSKLKFDTKNAVQFVKGLYRIYCYLPPTLAAHCLIIHGQVRKLNI